MVTQISFGEFYFVSVRYGGLKKVFVYFNGAWLIW